MGLFGGKKTYVASTCYNLAGPEEDRPDYLKTMVAANVIGSAPNFSMGDAIRTGYTSGPGVKLRGFYRWASMNYNSVISLSASGLAGAPDINPSLIASLLPGSASIQMIDSGVADYEVWAEQWVLTNHPERFTEAWTSDFNDSTGQITVELPSGPSATFTPSNFDKASLYIYATYNEVTTGAEGPVVAGPVVSLAPGDPFPSTSGWTTVSYTSTPQAGPPPWDEIHGVYTKMGPTLNDGTGRIYSVRTIMNQDQTGPDTRTYQESTQEVETKSWSPLRVFIYRVGSGNAALDAQVVASSSVGGFFPPIPVRLDNKFVSSSYLPTQYEAAQKAYKRLTGGGKFDELIEKLQDNEDLGDIDYAFVVPGVSLNARDNSARRYLYAFFSNAALTGIYGESEYSSWYAGLGDATGDMYTWADWLAAQGTGGPLDGTPEPPRATYGSSARNEIRVRTSSALGYDTRIAWKSIKEETGSGLGKPDAKVGDVWLTKGGSISSNGPNFSGKIGLIFSPDSSSQDLIITWQTSATSWKRLTVRGLVHQNYIYGGKYVEIKAHEALDDADESGFIVPIHYGTWSGMSIKDTTQMSTACIFLVLNSYQVVKQKWYQTGIFRIVLFIAVVALTIIFSPAGTAASGILGSSAAIGVALGFTGLVAVIVGTVANVLAAMLLAKIVSIGATAIFGEELGLIIGAVVTILAMNIGEGLQSGLSAAEVLTELMNPMTLLNMTSSLVDGVAAHLNAKTAGIYGKTQELMEDYTEQSREISDLYEQNIGYGRGVFDPTLLQSASQWYVESGETFLSRTLMTGSDIAELSTSMLSNFSELTLTTKLP